MVSHYFESLPVPPLENLTTEYILQEIIDHIGKLADDFPHTKLNLFRKQLWDIRNRNVEPKTHLRGLLRVLENTHTFKHAFEELEPGLQAQIRVFMDDEKDVKEGEIMGMGKVKGEFYIPPSPAVKHHFKEMVKETVREKAHEKKMKLVQSKVMKKIQEAKEEIEREIVEEVGGHIEMIQKVEDHVGEFWGRHGHLGALLKSNPVASLTEKWDASMLEIGLSPRICEDERGARIMEVHKNAPFHNWGNSVKNTPLYTFVPTTVLGLSNLVKWAKVEGYRVRCSGYRHSWSNTFSQDKQILVSMLNLESVEKIPDVMSITEEKGDVDLNGDGVVDVNELKTIELAPKIEGLSLTGDEEGKMFCRVGAAVTNEQFRRWAVGHGKWALPVDVILVEVTAGGVNGPICHGAGRRHQTVSDYVRAIEYIDANGIHRTITKPAHLRAAAGCFGLLGIVTHITLLLSPMTYAILRPTKPDIALAIPPLSPTDIPIALRKSWTPAQYADALEEFEDKANNDYYSEWFWFTRSQQAWVNTWNETVDAEGAVEYPSPFDTFVQWVQGWVGSVLTRSEVFGLLPGRWQACILSTFGMVALPPFEFNEFEQKKTVEYKTALPNGLHFRRGIQNMRVRDLEFQIPIPCLPNATPDYTIVRRAWWDIINLCYRDSETPMRLTLELRIMGDSNLIMAPQRGNRWGTASIEILSVPDAVRDEEWVPFCQEVVDLWAGYRGRMRVGGEEEDLNVRPHWAKEWEGVKIRGRGAREYLREVGYKEEVGEFRSVLGEIGKEQGWGLGDLKGRFSNELWDYLVFDGVEVARGEGEEVQSIKVVEGTHTVVDGKEMKPRGIEEAKMNSSRELIDYSTIEKNGDGKGKGKEQERGQGIKDGEVKLVEAKGIVNGVKEMNEIKEVKSSSSSSSAVPEKVIGIPGIDHARGVFPIKFGR
ncbi:hypothetical protein BELL_0526g00010 [Botrytis elliptica]|uniref:FAD-binding PCMH-type domain-containing protein n=1 Tax=Botrytis elliptica TaxID=278938 RepID=A0A4Z1JDJ7_9HELO|nr:hypothetical protein EAE99_001928 [Botrytis elliptica]TGO71811.1 hypothetical protein BELL_0526g00010 [Botrytis elliptica]